MLESTPTNCFFNDAFTKWISLFLMESVFRYNDYRQYLRDYYEDQKSRNKVFSFRYLGLRLQLDAGTLQRITQGKAHLSQGSIYKVVAYFKLNPREADYFETLVHLNKSCSKVEIQRLRQQLQQLRDLEILTLSDLHYIYFSQWYHAALRSLIGMGGISDNYAEISQCLSPHITPLQAQQSISLLSALGMISKNPSGYWCLVNKVLSTGGKWESLAIRQYQHNIIILAAESLERHHKDVRDISTLTLAIRKDSLPQYRKRCAEFRKELMKMAMEEETDPDAVFQVNVQIFPLGYKNYG